MMELLIPIQILLTSCYKDFCNFAAMKFLIIFLSMAPLVGTFLSVKDQKLRMLGNTSLLVHEQDDKVKSLEREIAEFFKRKNARG
jgi:hypothetical protein